jgi:hypothetical protein
VPHDVGFALDARVAAGDGGAWSPWLEVVHSGAAIPEVRPAQDVPSSEDLLEFSDELARPAFDGGRVESARFNSTRVWHRVQYRVRARYDQKAPGDAVVRVRRVVVVASRRGEAAAASSLVAMNPAAVRRLKFPVWHVGGSEPEDGAPLSLFSSVSAAVVHRGARLGGLDEVLGEMHVDPMGLAPSAFVHAAYELQVPGYFARYSSWRDIEQLIADGQPLVIGVEADNPDLDRWVVLCGFDKRGDALVNDALAEDMDTVSQTLPRERLTRDWLARGGMALVFLPREK